MKLNCEQQKANSKLYDYKVLSAFNDIFYAALLQKKHMNESELYIQELKTPDDKAFGTAEVKSFFNVLTKNGVAYLLKSDWKVDLPLEVIEYEKVGYMGKGYRLVKNYKTARFKPEKTYNFRELVSEIAHFEHTSPKDIVLYKIMVLSSFIERINLRVASEPAFGKDSFVSILDNLMSGFGVIQNPTIAKLEYMSGINKVMMCNELVNLNAEEIRSIEQFLLATGDFKNKYTKHSRAGKGVGREEIDISKLSLIIAYNNRDCYIEDAKYFDDMFQKAVRERFMPFKMKGKLQHVFYDHTDAPKMAEENVDYFRKVIKTIMYYRESWRNELKPYSEIDYGLPTRYKRAFDVMCRFINLYSANESEYKDLVGTLYSRYIDYNGMIDPKYWKNSGEVKEPELKQFFEPQSNKPTMKFKDSKDLNNSCFNMGITEERVFGNCVICGLKAEVDCRDGREMCKECNGAYEVNR